MGFRLAFSYLTLDHCNGQDTAHFDWKSRKQQQIGQKLLLSNLPAKRKSQDFDWFIYLRDWPILTVKVMPISTEYLRNGNRYDKHYYCNQIESHHFWLLICIFTLTMADSKGQVHAHLRWISRKCEQVQHYYCHQIGIDIAFWLVHYVWTWLFLNVKVKVNTNVWKIAHITFHRLCACWLPFLVYITAMTAMNNIILMALS